MRKQLPALCARAVVSLYRHHPVLLTHRQSEIPEKWRAAALSKIEVPSNEGVRTHMTLPTDVYSSPHAAGDRVSGFLGVTTAMRITVSSMTH